MNLYLDCEFNEFKGELISMALVSNSGHEWYEVLECNRPKPWVKQHVIPVLNKDAVTIDKFQQSLRQFLGQFSTIHVVADWPEDIAHFCNTLITGPGERMNTPPLTMEVKWVACASKIPHNALSDARGIRDELCKPTELTKQYDTGNGWPVRVVADLSGHTLHFADHTSSTTEFATGGC